MVYSSSHALKGGSSQLYIHCTSGLPNTNDPRRRGETNHTFALWSATELTYLVERQNSLDFELLSQGVASIPFILSSKYGTLTSSEPVVQEFEVPSHYIPMVLCAAEVLTRSSSHQGPPRYLRRKDERTRQCSPRYAGLGSATVYRRK
jgi:hypothetical protein